jgi:hypothetical protein
MLLKQPKLESEDEIFLAVAGIKQVGIFMTVAEINGPRKHCDHVLFIVPCSLACAFCDTKGYLHVPVTCTNVPSGQVLLL